jgi:antitoxin component YwqK of YwqJK toxin-antitoxin module
MKLKLVVLFFLSTFLFLFASSCDNKSAPSKKHENPSPSQQDSLSNFTNKGIDVDDDLGSVALEFVEKKDDDGNTLRFSQRQVDKVLEGKYEKVGPNGKKIEEAFYRGGKYEGPRILYYEPGDTQVVESYQLGSFEGRYKLFYPNGKLKMTGFYNNNAMNGLWYQYYETGQLKEEVTFRGNNENGSFREYHKNGTVSVEGSYKNGDKEQGPLKMYNEAGELVKIMECNQGVCRTIWPKKK